MSALEDALRHPANRPGALVRRLAAQVNPAADLHGLEDGGGSICDFRRGLEEKDPSLSVSVGREGTVFTRFGGDGFDGGAVDFVMSCLNVSKGEAARLLIEWAGIPDTPGERKTGGFKRGASGRKAYEARQAKKAAAPTPTPSGSTKTPASKPTLPTKARRFDAGRVLEKLAAQGPVNPDALAYALRAWVKIEAGEDTPEHAELARRGLTPALSSGGLRAYRFTGKVGKVGGVQKTVSLPGHILPGAVAFEVRGPDGQVWAVKVRNPGTKEDLKAARAQRYVYLTKGGHSPAWCAPDFLEDPTRPALIVEGELNAVAVRVMLEAAGQGSAYRVQGVASSDAWPHVAGLEAGRVAYLYADPDPEGDAAREAWGKLCAHLGAEVRQVRKVKTGRGVFSFPSPEDVERGEMVTAHDACDFLSPERMAGIDTPESHAARRGRDLLEALERAHTWQPPAPVLEDSPADEAPGEEGGDVWLSKSTGYGVRDGKLCALTMKKGEDGEEYEVREVLAEFTARIVSEVSQEDGTGEAPRVFEIEGARPDGRPMRPARVKVTAADFAAMNWPVKEWGAGAVVHAGQGKKDKARVAIQMLSARLGIVERTVYQHTGWIRHPEHGPLYLTAGAVIGAHGGVPGVDVELSGRLTAYALPDPAKGEDGQARPLEEVRDAVRASLALLELAPGSVAVPVLGAVYRAPLGRLDAAVWLTGETGRNKTAFMGLAQAHYGAGWNREHLPDGWNSSANALERTAFTVKDGLVIFDDFKPSGSQSETAKAQASVGRILQGVADGAGRGTLTADRKQRAGLFPRGVVMSSSETLPRGHSNRARAVIVDVTRPLIGKDPTMSAAYYRAEDLAGAGVYALAVAGYVQTVAGHFEEVRAGSPAHRARVRELAPHFEGAHGRTGKAAAELAYGWEAFLSFAVKVGAVSEYEAEDLWARVVLALEDTAKGQGAHLHEEDPVTRGLSLLSGLLAQGRVYLEGLEGGTPPEDLAASLGWQRHTFRTGDGEEETWRTRPGAVLIGWYSKAGGDEWAHFLPDALHEVLQRAVSGQGGAALPDAGTLWGNMRDRFHAAGLMRCEVEKRGGRVVSVRPFAKVTVNGDRMRLLTLRLPLSLPSYNVGTVGTVGTDGEETVSNTAYSPVPITLFFKKEVGTVGTVGKPSPSSFAVPAPSILSEPDSLADLAVIGEGEAWEVDV